MNVQFSVKDLRVGASILHNLSAIFSEQFQTTLLIYFSGRREEHRRMNEIVFMGQFESGTHHFCAQLTYSPTKQQKIICQRCQKKHPVREASEQKPQRKQVLFSILPETSHLFSGTSLLCLYGGISWLPCWLISSRIQPVGNTTSNQRAGTSGGSLFPVLSLEVAVSLHNCPQPDSPPPWPQLSPVILFPPLGSLVLVVIKSFHHFQCLKHSLTPQQRFF